MTAFEELPVQRDRGLGFPVGGELDEGAEGGDGGRSGGVVRKERRRAKGYVDAVITSRVSLCELIGTARETRTFDHKA